jgi:PAS domain S-box-containing protein
MNKEEKMFSELQTRKRNIIYIRALLTLVITLLGVYKLNYIMSSAQYVGYYIIVLVASNFVLMLLPSRLYEGIKLHFIIFMMDIIFVALGAYWLANLDFLFFMMIFVTIFISAIGQSVGLSIIVSIIANVFYFFIRAMIAQSGGPEAAGTTILLNIPFIFMVALHSGYMAERANEDAEGINKLRKSNQALTGRVNDMNTDIAAHEEYEGRIFDSFREGVIILDENGLIKQFNKKCEAIFGIKKVKIINYLYKEVHELGDVVKLFSEIKSKNQVSYEKEITVNAQGELKHLIVGTGFIRDREDKIRGYLCTIRQKITGMAEGV